METLFIVTFLAENPYMIDVDVEMPMISGNSVRTKMAQAATKADL